MDETEKTARRNRKRRKTNPVWVILIILLAIVFLFSSFKVASILSSYHTGENEYESLTQYVSARTDSDSPAAEAEKPVDTAKGTFRWDFWNLGKGSTDTAPQDSGRISVDFEALRQINDDVVGWIYFPDDETVNYPVVQGKTNDSYLHRMFTGKGNDAGSIFMDAGNSPDLSDPNTILYGHHMNNGSMFASLVKYKKEDYFKEHPVFHFVTPDAYYEAQVISCYVANTSMNPWEIGFVSEEKKAAWVAAQIKRSQHKTDYSYSQGDQFMTLSTCSYEFDDARYVVIGVIRKIG